MEHSFIAWAKQRSSKLPSVKLGIGDDCALLATAGEDMVVTTDSLCDGTHFILKECGPRRAGKKLIGVNLSDLASMAATPVAVFLSLCLPRSSAGDIAAELFEGVFEVAKQYDVSIAGGDTNVWDGPLVIHMTAIGKTDPGSAWTRSGANVGDAVFVSGLLGGSILGKHLDDISDGLGIDLLNLTVASRCGAEVKLDQIPLSEAARELAKTSGKNAVDHALGDGEDFELLMTVRGESADQFPSQALGIPLTRIGTIVGRTGLWTKEKSGVKQLPPKGYVHR
jgi:thiamine-monophosphate kinase